MYEKILEFYKFSLEELESVHKVASYLLGSSKYAAMVYLEPKIKEYLHYIEIFNRLYKAIQEEIEKYKPQIETMRNMTYKSLGVYIIREHLEKMQKLLGKEYKGKIEQYMKKIKEKGIDIPIELIRELSTLMYYIRKIIEGLKKTEQTTL